MLLLWIQVRGNDTAAYTFDMPPESFTCAAGQPAAGRRRTMLAAADQGDGSVSGAASASGAAEADGSAALLLDGGVNPLAASSGLRMLVSFLQRCCALHQGTSREIMGG